MKSKTKISKQSSKKKSSELLETVAEAKKKKGWTEVASKLSGPRRNLMEVNLSALEGKETLIVVGKVLSMGEIKGKIKVAALSFSQSAKEKLNKAGCETLSILEEIKKNPEGKGIKILK